MKAKRHDWSEGLMSFCRDGNCNWLRRIASGHGGAGAFVYEYKRTDEGETWWRRLKDDAEPPCEGSET